MASETQREIIRLFRRDPLQTWLSGWEGEARRRLCDAIQSAWGSCWTSARLVEIVLRAARVKRTKESQQITAAYARTYGSGMSADQEAKAATSSFKTEIAEPAL